MTRDDIIRMAREAGSIDSDDVIKTVWSAFTAAEREACAQVCEQMSSKFAPSRLELLQCLGETLQDAADNIRARGEK